MGCCCSRCSIINQTLPDPKPTSFVELPVFVPFAASPVVSPPPQAEDGSVTVKMDPFNYELKYASLSQRGLYPDALDKLNQDSLCIYGSSSYDYFFAVFDGHGEFGAQCSQFAQTRIRENLFTNTAFPIDPAKSLQSAFITTNAQLREAPIDDSMSGTTAVAALLRGKSLYVANAGDSRALVAERIENGDLTAIDLSIDQTPYREDELERVKQCGARVLTLDQIEGVKDPAVKCWGNEAEDGGDPPRVWAPSGMLPGTAFTRSVGDAIAESVGVIAEPEISTFELTEKNPFIVLASDGVFEFMSSQDVVEMVAKFDDPTDACTAVVAESFRLWLQFETRTDDISIIVVYINGLKAEYNMVVPSSLKSEKEEAHVEKAVREHFLFKNLTESQFGLLLDCARKIEFQGGEAVVIQGGEGDCFYVVESGEFEVFSEDGNKEGERYTAEKLSSFGESSVMYDRPAKSSVRAVTRGTLWALKRDDFRGIVMSEFTNMNHLKMLRSIKGLSKLTILELSHIAESLAELSLSDGEKVVDGEVTSLYLINKGKVKLTFGPDSLNSDNMGTLRSDGCEATIDASGYKTVSLENIEGTYFGEWALFGEPVGPVKAVAVGNCSLSVLPKAAFDSIVKPTNGPGKKGIETSIS